VDDRLLHRRRRVDLRLSAVQRVHQQVAHNDPAAGEGYWIAWLVLLFASAGVFHHSGIKIPYFAFFAHDSGKRCKEAPLNMLIAMGLTAFLSVAIGIYPQPLYALLPYSVDFAPYTTAHVITQLQLLLFSALAFAVLIRTGLYPAETPSVNLDSDWMYRRVLPAAVGMAMQIGQSARNRLLRTAQRRLQGFIATIYRHHGPEGILARTWPTGSTVLWVAILLASYLLVYYL